MCASPWYVIIPPTPPTPPSTLVLELPRTNFGAHGTLIYDPMLSYSDFTETETNPSNPESNRVSFATAESHLLGYFVATATNLFGWGTIRSTRFGWSGKRGVIQSQYRRHMNGRCLKVLGESFSIQCPRIAVHHNGGAGCQPFQTIFDIGYTGCTTESAKESCIVIGVSQKWKSMNLLTCQFGW